MIDFYDNDQFLLNQVRLGQKKALKKNAFILAVLLLCYNFLLNGLVYVYYYVFYTLKSHKFTLSYSVAVDFIRENIENYSVTEFEMLGNIFVTVFSTLGIILIAGLFFKINILSFFKSDKKGVVLGVRAFPFSLLTNYVFAVFVAIISAMFASQGVIIPDADFSLDKPTFIAGFLMFLYTVILAPVIEEIIYRGLVIKLISPYGKKLAVILSAFIFGLMHGNLSQFVTAFAAGLVLSSVALKTNSIMPTIIMHSLNNGINFVLICGEDYSSEVLCTIYYALFACVLLLGVMEIFLHRKIVTKKIQETTLLSKQERIKTVLLNPAMLVYFAYLVYEFVKEIVLANI